MFYKSSFWITTSNKWLIYWLIWINFFINSSGLSDFKSDSPIRKFLIPVFEVIKTHKGPIISESGIRTANDAKYIYEKTGINNFLIGESLLKSDNPGELMKKLIQLCQ